MFVYPQTPKQTKSPVLLTSLQCVTESIILFSPQLETYQNDRGILDLPRLHKYADVIIRRTSFNPILLNTFVPTVTEIEQKKRSVTRRERDAVAEKKTSEKVRPLLLM